MTDRINRRPLIAAATTLGIGMGGFVDGILFHQILQWHGMLTSVHPPTSITNIEINMFWDGLFHIVTWTMTALGLALLWRAMTRPDASHSTQTLLGSTAMGWGIFNVVEGIIDHHILHIHHVTETADHLAWDIGFIVFGLVLIGVGATLISKAGTEFRSMAAGR